MMRCLNDVLWIQNMWNKKIILIDGIKHLFIFSLYFLRTNNISVSYHIFSRIYFFFPSIKCSLLINIKQNKEIHWTIKRYHFTEFKTIKMNVCLTWYCDKLWWPPSFRSYIQSCAYQNWYIVSPIIRPWTRFTLG